MTRIKKLILISDDVIFVRNIDITMVLMPKYESWWQWGLKRWWKLYGWALIAFGIYKHGLHPDMAWTIFVSIYKSVFINSKSYYPVYLEHKF